MTRLASYGHQGKSIRYNWCKSVSPQYKEYESATVHATQNEQRRGGGATAFFKTRVGRNAYTTKDTDMRKQLAMIRT